METAGKGHDDRIARAALMALMAIFCAVTWQKWGTVVIDCGRELYVPAALSQGKRLYFDIWYPYGPLIPCWHALLFRTFGIHLWLLETAGIAIAGVTTWSIYSLSRMFLPVSLAFAAGLVCLIQAFEVSGTYGAEFNYVLPYSYPAAYATMMLVVMTWLLVRDTVDPKPWTMLAAGSIAGLTAITKIEFGMSAYVVVAAAILVRTLRSRSLRAFAKSSASCAPGLLLAAGVYGWYIQAGSARLLFGDNISILPDSYFMKVMGAHWAHIAGAAAPPGTIVLCGLSGLLGAPLTAALVRFASVSRVNSALVAAAALALSVVHLVLLYASQFGRGSVPVLLLDVAPFVYFNRGMVFTSGILLVWILLKWRCDPAGDEAALLVMLVAGIALGSRTMFQMRTAGYSIFYDSIVFVGYLVAVRMLAGIFHVPKSPRLWTCTSALLCCGLMAVTARSYDGIRSRSFIVSFPRGSIYEVPWTGRAFTETLGFLNQAKTRSESFVVWPEEAAFYYFTGTTAPSRWWCLTPGVLPPGEVTSRFLEELDRQQVKYVALSNRSAPEYNMPTFGIDYNQQVYQWLERNFRVVRTFGDYQRVDPGYWAAKIWERKQPQSTGTTAEPRL
ncbi:MAG: hypothetical protein ABSH56_00465 [Bryobacteraceae bacterium]